MRLFTVEQIGVLESLLRQDGSGTALRDLAQLRIGIDSMLRSDIVALTVRDVMPNGEIDSALTIR